MVLAHPRVDPGQGDSFGTSPLFVSCFNAHVELVRLLLQDPRVDPNQQDGEGVSPFLLSCELGHPGVVELLLGDERVDLTLRMVDGQTAFSICCEFGRLWILKRMLVSGKPFDVHAQVDVEVSKETIMVAGWAEVLESIGKPFVEGRDIALAKGEQEVVKFVTRLEEDPAGLKRDVCRELGCMADLFGLMVLYSDGYLFVEEPPKFSSSWSKVLSFFELAKRLPLPLQMVLANRVYRDPNMLIKTSQIETSLKSTLAHFGSRASRC